MLLFLDGQGHYDTARIGMKYAALTTGSCTWVVTTGGRTGNQIQRTSSAAATGSGALQITPTVTRAGSWVPTASGVVGFALRIQDLTGINVGIPTSSSLPEGLVVVMDGADYHLKLVPDVDGSLKVWRNTGVNNTGLLGQSAAGVLQSNAWAYVEFQWVLATGIGRAIVRVNGTTVINVTGDTLETDAGFASTGLWSDLRLLSVQSAASPLLVMSLCDVYLADLTAPLPQDVHDFAGDGSVQTILPSGVGAVNEWTPNAGANWDAVNEVTPDDDTSYVSNTTIGATDTYAFSDLVTPGLSIVGVQSSLLARMTTAGSATLVPVVRQGSVNYVGQQRGVTASVYDRFFLQPNDVNPATLVSFTVDEVNAGEYGVRRAG